VAPVFLIPWYLSLCIAQGVLVLIPSVGREGDRRQALLGAAGPAAAMVVGVAIVGLLGGAGASFLTWLGTTVTPVLAGALGWIARWRLPYLTVAAAAALYVVAWQSGGRAGQVAGALLIGGACLAIAGIVGPITPPGYLALGLVLLVALDTYLVFGTTQVATTTQALQATTLPHLSAPAGVSHPLPGLQEVALGNSSMGWLDFLAPALLGAVIGRHMRARLLAAIVVAATGFAWGFLLEVTSELPATVPVLAGLLVTWRTWAPGAFARSQRGQAP
jgi:hypothetical protein